MNFSRLNKLIRAYLGYRGQGAQDADGKTVEECVREVERLAHFNYVYRLFGQPPPFLEKQPYKDYLKGSDGVILCVTTLGAEIDRRIKYYGKADAARSVIFDAVASAYLEARADEYEQSIGGNLSYRFGIGYGGSDIGDIRHIFEILKPAETGVVLTDGCYMLPSKSMAGVIAVGKENKKTCAGCVAAEQCAYKKEGITCYGSEKK